MISYSDIAFGLQRLNIARSIPVIVHASLSAFGEVRGGASSIVGSLLSTFDKIILPTFTYQTMIIPEIGPPDNGIEYGTGKEQNQKAEFFLPDLPVDRRIGVVAETFRVSTGARRTLHPILSFAGINVDPCLNSQTLADPLSPIGYIANEGGYVLLLGVDHRSNTSIHYAERVSDRKQFVRWALTPAGVKTCPRFPGCSERFNEIIPEIRTFYLRVQVGKTWIQAIPLRAMINSVQRMISRDPFILLCNRDNCQRCKAVKSQVLSS